MVLIRTIILPNGLLVKGKFYVKILYIFISYKLLLQKKIHLENETCLFSPRLLDLGKGYTSSRLVFYLYCMKYSDS